MTMLNAKLASTKLSFFSIWEGFPYPGNMGHLLLDNGYEEVKTPDSADILVFNGGQDIATSIYGENPVFDGIPGRKTNRDLFEVELYDRFVGQKFFLGICRGAQLLNCLNGGKLWQHVNNHQRDHNMTDLTTGETIKVTSTHHQMMRPNSDLAQIIGVSSESTRKNAERDHETGDMKPDIEAVWYRNTRSLCIQGHPEYVPGSRFAEWSLELMNKKYEEQLVCVG